MKAADLDILLQEGEGVMLEYKEGLPSSFARELVALANTAGGRILLGVRDDGTIKGIADTNQLRARLQDIARNCDPPVKILVQRIGDEARVQGCPEPLFEETGFVTATFFPNPEVRAQAGAQPAGATEQVGTKSALSRHHEEAHDKAHEPLSIVEHRLLKECTDEPQSSPNLLHTLGYKTRSGGFKVALSRLLAFGLLEMTIPDKPRSKKQRYRTTAAGRAILSKHDKEVEA